MYSVSLLFSAARKKPKRTDARYVKKLEARYEVFVGPVHERHFICQTAAVGRGGCTLVTGDRHERSGTKLFVHITLLDGTKLRLLGSVVRGRPPAKGPTGEPVPASMCVSFDRGQKLPAAYEALIDECAASGVPTEKEALAAYQAAHAAVEGEHGIKYMLEEQIILEQEDVWEIEKFLSMHQIQVKSKTIDLAAS